MRLRKTAGSTGARCLNEVSAGEFRHYRAQVRRTADDCHRLGCSHLAMCRSGVAGNQMPSDDE